MLAEQLDLVLVDEFQDTSPLQLAIFLKLSELAPSVWVGDPKQAIFGFRGTDPALMDAAIESLSSLSRDADLVIAALDTVERQSRVDTLSRSFRSRPALVELTNAVFSRAFSKQQGMPQERVRTEPERSESPKLGPAVSHWPLSGAGRMSKDVLAQAVAAGVRDLLASQPTIRDRHTRKDRTATAADLAILCRTNDQCLRVSESLGQLGIASVVARVGLLATAEAQVLLAGRWIHFWPNPYTTSNQSGPVKDAYAQSEAHRYVSRQAEREALRVLYVGWTRACDHLILAAQQGKLLGGLLGTLEAIEPGMIREPAVTAGLVETTWAAHDFKLQITASQPAEPIALLQEPGTIRAGRPLAVYAPASLSPSSASPRPARLGKPERLGPPVRIHRSVDMDVLGTTIHNFFAADDPLGPKPDRLALAAGLLDRHQVAGALAPADLLELGNRLWRWVRKRFGPDSRLRTEWPLGLELETGTLLLGTADLLVETGETFAIIDHKSFGWATAQTNAEALAGQLGCYADVVARALPGKTVSTLIHLPLEGMIAEVQAPPPRQLLAPESPGLHPRQLPLF